MEIVEVNQVRDQEDYARFRGYESLVPGLTEKEKDIVVEQQQWW